MDGTDQYENISVRGKAGILATSALFSNSVLNPILYVLRMAELRKELKRLFISIWIKTTVKYIQNKQNNTTITYIDMDNSI